MKELDSIISALRDITSTLSERIHKLEIQEQEPVVFQDVSASADLLLTTVAQDIPGASLLITPGAYVIFGMFSFRSGADALDNTFQGIGSLVSTDSQPTEAVFNLFYDAVTGLRLQGSICKIWHSHVYVDEVIKLQARKTGGTGASEVVATDTMLIAARLSIIG